ncbi:hypothetical protein XSR1_430005 [Xenorhabdus szentirmaii DSM 16338]|uniref:Uncharacterized protein n=1 Tax=Xenorhabdus szentirmaii DSM 16338 TaxID=1427518 RepID=W1J0L1_9GAMM|nr:hypothetical protein XSR1_430005 [Xenorhabdus szentirmaii DSM 16338]
MIIVPSLQIYQSFEVSISGYLNILRAWDFKIFSLNVFLSTKYIFLSV